MGILKFGETRGGFLSAPTTPHLPESSRRSRCRRKNKYPQSGYGDLQLPAHTRPQSISLVHVPLLISIVRVKPSLCHLHLARPAEACPLPCLSCTSRLVRPRHYSSGPSIGSQWPTAVRLRWSQTSHVRCSSCLVQFPFPSVICSFATVQLKTKNSVQSANPESRGGCPAITSGVLS